MGLNVYVFRDDLGDCTNGGVSSKAAKLCVTNVEGPSEPTEDAPAVVLRKGPLNTVHLVPEVEGDDRPWFTFGGNFGYTSDSRFQRAVEALAGGVSHVAIAIHDRVE